MILKIKFIFKKILVFILFNIFSKFFDKKYLKGRYFERSLIGYKWCFQSIIFRILGFNKNIRYPFSINNRVDEPHNLIFDNNDLQNLMHFGCYFSNVNGGKIIIGKGTVIAPNCGFITTNHQKKNVHLHDEPKDILIGKNCWIGMNVVILPGVCLADEIIVGAGSIVTKSFMTKGSILAGNPARLLNES
jgi:acetyltransferase-like isoleucine patch superfamily enzyme